ncbi:MAG TPA: RDD family protein [Mycobacteriales bacterium]|nr:RDD family protein [Mycobacteriales bacterium]
MLGSWLSGPSAAGDGAAGGAGSAGGYRGARLGLPEAGPGSLAGTAARVGAFCLDAALSALVAGLFTAPALPRNWSLVALVVDYVVFTSIFGQTPGMRLFGLRLVRADRPAPVGVPRAVIRTVLLALLVPALIWDSDGRGLHDRASATVVVRA